MVTIHIIRISFEKLSKQEKDLLNNVFVFFFRKLHPNTKKMEKIKVFVSSIFGQMLGFKKNSFGHKTLSVEEIIFEFPAFVLIVKFLARKLFTPRQLVHESERER